MLAVQHQDRLQRNQLDEVNKPQFRVKLAQTVFQQKLHPAARLFSSHIHFLASYQAAFNYLSAKKSFKDQIDRELLLIHHSEANKRRRTKRAAAKRREQQQQPTSITILSSAPLTSPAPSNSKSRSPSPDKTSRSPSAEPEKDIEQIIEEDILAYGEIEIFPPN